MKTVLITGTSSGYGRETVLYFHSQGWNVIATMRTPRTGVLPESDRLRIVELDVTRPESITGTFDAVGPVDVLVNNTGVPSISVFEGTPMARVREVFETNTFGVMATNGGSPEESVPAPYAPWVKKAMDDFTGQDLFTKESDVAETVWRAVHDTTGRLRFPAGPDAVWLAQAK
ncbi:SDR family NAD(P)-dependent oxidoreductase [Streptosporangium amethystogenes]|uniref:SDR family NAD(P)-dependent oxidoreductase n=1 Tax=Streptosporangium amethystogenes TaxID=2002 RepID=UPI0004CAFF82|nr:SDR family NAD(P)-dependent oxidoreductase [Streptosporangium amethystogenes]